ncbi:MAG: hypothetical protein JF590_07970 [Gemmatimonadetes bacterium]|nr:hypothetical protein [Gemmatimonadota bacterium]
MRHLTFAALAAALILGCTPDRPKLPSLPAAFSTLPLPPSPEYLGQSGSEDALMFTFRSATPADTVAEFYRRMFASDTLYHMISNTKGAQGEHAYYVEYAKRPLWVRIRPEAGNEGSIIELTGAVVAGADTTHRTVADTAKPDTAHRAAAPAPRTPSTRRP